MSSISRTWSVPLLLVLLSGPLTACTTTRSTGIPDRGVCAVWLPLTYSATGDTAETVLAIRQNNAKRQAFCQ